MSSVETLARLDPRELDVLEDGVRRDRDDPAWPVGKLVAVREARRRLLWRIAAAREMHAVV